MGILFIALIGDGDFTNALFHKSKAGYWFTFVAFEIYSIYAFTAFIIDKCSSSLQLKSAIYILIIILALPLSYWIGKSGFNNSTISGLFSIVSVISYIPFFILGIIAKMYHNYFIRFIENKWMISIVIIIFSTLHTVGNLYGINIKLIFYGTAGVILVYIVFHNFRYYFNCNTIVGKILSYIGKRTLPIYLTHYFLLNGIAPAITIPFIQNNCGMDSWIHLLFYSLIIYHLHLFNH